MWEEQYGISHCSHIQGSLISQALSLSPILILYWGAVLLKGLEATVSVFGQLGHLVQCFSPDEMLLLRPMLGAMSQLCLGATWYWRSNLGLTNAHPLSNSLGQGMIIKFLTITKDTNI